MFYIGISFRFLSILFAPIEPLSSSPFPRSIESSSLRFPRRILEEEWKWRLIGHDSELSILDLNNNKQ